MFGWESVLEDVCMATHKTRSLKHIIMHEQSISYC